MMGTEILKIDAEMAEKTEVEVGNPHLESDRKSNSRKTTEQILMTPTVSVLFYVTKMAKYFFS